MSNTLTLNKMKRVYIMMMLLLTGIMAEAQTSVWDGSKKIWTRGSGTESDPYLIETAANLAFLSYMVNKDFDTQGLYFRLTTDIDLNGSEDQPWKPIGLYNRGVDEDGCDRGSLNSVGYSLNTAFRGHFDGGGHVISNIYVDNENGYAGLFGYADARTEDEVAIIENVLVSDGYIKGNICGGIVGYGGRLIVSYCRNGAVVEGREIGGIVGNGSKTVNNCSNAGPLTGSDVGGIVGGKPSGTEITECFNEGDIMADRIGGGILCASNKATINNCYNTGGIFVTGEFSTYFPAAGGLVGIVSSRVEAKNSYNVGEITGNHHVGCLIGYAVSPENINVENCYYLNVCSGSEFGVAKSAEEMRDNAFVGTLNQGSNVWGRDLNNVNNGFPILTSTDLSVNENAEKHLAVYPNPSDRIVNIEGIEPVKVQVYNSLGQLVGVLSNINRISVEDLSEGIYLLRITASDGATYSKRLVVR